MEIDSRSQGNLVVSTLEDENDGNFSAGDLSLREAIANAEAGATITFDPSLSGGTILLDGEELSIDKSLTIDAASANGITINGNSNVFGGGSDNRVLNIDDGDESTAQNVVLNRLTITGTFTFKNGAGVLNQENLTLNNSIVSGNRSFGGAAGINSSGTLKIANSTISNNSAESGAAGINSSGTLKIANSTIADNFAEDGVGGINSTGSLEISNSTITNNTALLYDADGISATDITITSSIVSGNDSLARSIDLIGAGAFTSGGNNLIGNAYLENFEDSDNGDIIGTMNGPFDIFNLPDRTDEEPIDALLGELQDNGGVTPTVALQPGSPAIDAGSNPNNLATDQRGNGFDRTIGEATDIGAFEVQTITDNPGGSDGLVVSTVEDENDGDFSAGDLSLREAIALAEAGETISFDSSLGGSSIVLTQGELVINKSISIDAGSVENIAIDGNDNSRVFNVDDGNATQADVSIVGLRIINANSTNSRSANDGGGVLNRENLTLTNTEFSNNFAPNGSAIFNTGQLQLDASAIGSNRGLSATVFNTNGGTATVSNTNITGNSATGVSAVSNSQGSNLILSDSTITSNESRDTAVLNSEDSTATITNTVIAENRGSLIPVRGDVVGTIVSGGNNTIGNADFSTGFDEPSDNIGTADAPITI